MDSEEQLLMQTAAVPSVMIVKLNTPGVDYDTECGWVADKEITMLLPYDIEHTEIEEVMISSISFLLASLEPVPMDNAAVFQPLADDVRETLIRIADGMSLDDFSYGGCENHVIGYVRYGITGVNGDVTIEIRPRIYTVAEHELFDAQDLEEDMVASIELDPDDTAPEETVKDIIDNVSGKTKEENQ